MYFANPWGLLGLAALPAILIVHLFHQRFPPLLVAGAHLWGAETRITTAGRRRDRLPVTASLLLELLAALLLTIALSEPHFGATDEVVHIISVLDDSASMLAHAPNEPSPRDLAIADLRRRAEEGGRGSRLTLIRSGIHPTLLGSRGMTWDEAEPMLGSWQPAAARHDFASAWDEAAQVAGETKGFLFLTDSVPQPVDELPAGMEVMAFGRRLDNVAISAARWTFDSVTGRGDVFFRVSNYGAAPARVQVTGTSAGQPVFQQALEIRAGGESPLQIQVPGGLGKLLVTVSTPGDGLETDNRVTLIEPKVRMVTVAVTLPADSLELRLVQRVLAALPDLQPGPVKQAHLVIGPASALPTSLPDLWWLGIGPLDPAQAPRDQAVALSGPFILDKQHPLLEGVVLDGVVWGGVQPTTADLTPLVSCNRLPLLAQLAGTRTTAFLLNIDLSVSNLDRSPDWPIVLTNLVELRRAALPGLQRWNYRSNEVVRFRAPRLAEGATEELSLASPNGSSRPLIRDRQDVVEMAGLEDTGVYQIRRGAQVFEELAVNFFDPEESTLLNLAPGRRTPPKQFEPTLLRIDNPYSWLIVLSVLLILAAVLLDWHVVRPRQTMARTG
jgi:hypothetical protein